MAEAIIVDDGGSTRIKRVMHGQAVGAMDSLLDVDDLPDGTRGSGHTVNDSYTKLLIVIQDKDGKPFEINVPSFTTVTISSGLSQEIRLDKSSSAVKITVFSSTSDPIVESKQHNKKRRYVVSNSGPIEKIVVGTAVKFNIRKGEPQVLPSTTSGTATPPIVYTSVVLT
jgi:hypothetical protein